MILGADNPDNHVIRAVSRGDKGEPQPRGPVYINAEMAGGSVAVIRKVVRMCCLVVGAEAT